MIMNTMSLTPAQLQTLRHMLGIDRPQIADPVPCRNYAAANRTDPEFIELERIGAIERYSTQGGYCWYRTTDAGRSAAIASHKRIRLPKPKRLYSRYLHIADAFLDLTFKAFLTRPEFAASRKAA